MKLSDREKLLILFNFRLYEHFHVILDSYDFADMWDWHITIESLWKYTPDKQIFIKTSSLPQDLVERLCVLFLLISINFQGLNNKC